MAPLVPMVTATEPGVMAPDAQIGEHAVIGADDERRAWCEPGFFRDVAVQAVR